MAGQTGKWKEEQVPKVNGLGKRLLNAAEAAAYLGLAEQTVRQWASMEKLPKVKVGVKALRFRKEDLDQFIEAGWVPARPQE